MKKLIVLSSVLSAGVLLAACGNSSEGAEGSGEEKLIHLSTSPGPYSELFFEEVAPILEEQGYSIDETNFATMRPANMALHEGQVNLNVEQNEFYMNNFNEEAGTDFVAVGQIPTLPSALYPAEKTSLEEVEEGDVVGIPQDPANLNRALLILEKIGWITLDSSAGSLNMDLESIEENHAGVEITPIESTSIPPSLPDLDYAVIPGAVVYDAGLDSSSALAREDVLDELFLQVVVNSEDQDEEWVQDVVAAYQSEEFLNTMEEINQDASELNWVIPN